MTREAGRFGRTAALVAAILGWLFDGFEMGLFPLIGQPALADLLGSDAPAGDAAKWFGAIIAVFLVGAATAALSALAWMAVKRVPLAGAPAGASAAPPTSGGH